MAHSANVLKSGENHEYLLTIVVPTFNEAAVITPFLKKVGDAMSVVSFPWEVLVVDDSTDNTPELLQNLSEKYDWLRYIHRSKIQGDETGLSSALMTGLFNARGTFVITMDADGSHPADSVRQMAEVGIEQEFDILVPTRYREGGSAGGLENFRRRLYSDLLRWLPRVLFPKKLRNISDPLTGFIFVRRSILRFGLMRAIGWKFSLEILLFSQAARIGEFPYTFEERMAGESKANLTVGLAYLYQLFSLMWRYYFVSIFSRIGRPRR